MVPQQAPGRGIFRNPREHAREAVVRGGRRQSVLPGQEALPIRGVCQPCPNRCAGRPLATRTARTLVETTMTSRTAAPQATSAPRVSQQAPGAAGPAPSRILYLDLLKILAIVGVLVMHSSAQFFYDGRVPTPYELRICYLFTALANYCVPIFVMCSGAMLLSTSREAAPLPFYTKRLPRLVIPLVIWSLVYFVYGTNTATMTLATIPQFLTLLLAGKIKAVLWFMYMLIGVYLSAPFLQMIVRKASRPQLYLFTIFCLFLWPLQETLQVVLQVSLGLDHSIFRTYIGYFVLGYLLHTARPVQWRGRLGLLGIYGLMVWVTFAGQLFMQTHFSPSPYNFQTYDTPNVVLMSAVLYLLVRNLDFSSLQPFAPRIAAVANATYGIYLMHMLLQSLLQRGVLGFTLAAPLWPPVFGVLLASACLFILSLAFVLLLSKVPTLRKAVGYK